MATHVFDAKQNKMVAVPRGQEKNINMSFLVLRDGKAIFEGTAQELATSDDHYLREYLN